MLDEHRHLGATLSNDAKWSRQINEISRSYSKKVAVLRKCKYVLNTKTCLQE